MFREILIALRGLAIVSLVLWILLILVYFPYNTDAPPSTGESTQLKTYYDADRPVEPAPFEVRFSQLHKEVNSAVTDFAQHYDLTHKKVLEVGAGTGYLQDVVDDYTDGMRRPVSETGSDKLPKMRLRRGRGDRL